jgi:hypothetical protein
VNDRMSIDVVDGSHDAVLEFLFGSHANVAQNGAGKLGEETFDQVEPGAVLGCERERKAARRLRGEPSSCLLGDVRGMIVEDQLDRGVSRIGGIVDLVHRITNEATTRSLMKNLEQTTQFMASDV